VATEHRVEPGDSLYTIAKRFRILNWRSIYDAAENAALREIRPNPHVLQPGDIVVIPDSIQSGTGIALDRRVVVTRRKRGNQPLRVVIRKNDEEPLANLDYRIAFQGGEAKGQTDKNGLIREEIPVGVIKVDLTAGDRSWTLMVGHLNPLAETSDQGIHGAQGRLKNLKYYFGPVDGASNADFKEALEHFQTDHELPVTGEFDEETRDELLSVHGS